MSNPTMARTGYKYYAVRSGGKPGVYNTWEECQEQVSGFKRCVFRAFSTEDAAWDFVNGGEVKVESSTGAKKPSFRYYAVAIGRKPGIYTEYAKAQDAHSGYMGAVHKGFDLLEEAERYMSRYSKASAEEPMPIFDDEASSDSDMVKREEDEKKYSPISLDGDDDDKNLMPPPASQSYFDLYAGFKPDKDASFDNEFSRFASSQGLVSGTQEYRKQRTKAICHELKFHFSDNAAGFPEDNSELTEEERLEIYQNMCRVIEIEPRDTAEACARALKSEWVNIIDFIDAARMGKKAERWDDWGAFRDYSLDDEHRIDLGVAKENGFLVALLQRLRSEDAPCRTVSESWAPRASSGRGGKRKQPSVVGEYSYKRARLHV
ncbi:hypothetical protein F5B20DRAFT_563579 [Whalleya microplaca]|nr:hypothetical protein F5B20DRAFT_563579 [Whalleya microplaca]